MKRKSLCVIHYDQNMGGTDEKNQLLMFVENE